MVLLFFLIRPAVAAPKLKSTLTKSPPPGYEFQFDWPEEDKEKLQKCWNDSARYEFGEWKCGRWHFRRAGSLWHDPYDCWEGCSPLVNCAVSNSLESFKCEQSAGFLARCSSSWYLPGGNYDAGKKQC
ncbi:hypothetical protein JX265_005813 [Neoarthrinium moseri]|uniref:Uncharacterized protein n=1 Tax=Neoarthrinium moseri TaxID=1658444 RepID=A0A9Q0AMK2_9PEZI|nr:hypothetical protein JX265_005813 [Neoarthrinium moseri]